MGDHVKLLIVMNLNVIVSRSVVEPFANHVMEINYLMWGYVVSIKVGREGLKIQNGGSRENINNHEFRCHLARM